MGKQTQAPRNRYRQTEEPNQGRKLTGSRLLGVLIAGVILISALFWFNIFNSLYNALQPQQPATPIPSLKTTTGPPKQFQPSQEAIYRLQDLNTYRQQEYTNRGPSGRNLSMAGLIGQKSDGSTVVLYTIIRWSIYGVGHSETLAATDVQNFLQSHPLDKDITALHMLIVSQFNICETCIRDVGAISSLIREQISPVTLLTSMWQVNIFIDPVDPKTWVAPNSPGDITLKYSSK